MGNESSVLVDESTAPATLKSRSVEGIAEYIKEKNIRRIVVLTGAGISTAAGIPDFRSPDTGVYANLARLNLPDPEAVFDISYFRKNPYPFYALSKEMFPGRYRPTLTHSFIKLLYDKGRLLKLFTQNIDCLERAAGVPGEMIVEAHGSYASHRCIECKASYPDDLMRKAINADDIPLCLECQGLVKPDIVFFGESLPEAFFMNRTLTAEADLCIIMGTSLTVQPFASLPSLCKEGCPRLLINLNRVGGLGTRPDDVLLLGECDDGVLKLAEALGWREELEALWAQTNPEKAGLMEEEKKKPARSKDELLRDEVERLTEEVEHTLHISRAHEDRVRSELQKGKKGEVVKGEDATDKREPTATSKDDEDRVLRKDSEPSESEQLDPVPQQESKPETKSGDDCAAKQEESSPPPAAKPNKETGQETERLNN
ncbi:NAD-dependent histone deacetylase SIR2 [Blastomyces silverae]|uniref:NAD-dependent histone deacetylase SIR2 n=1 Tax=Blastomyces silverae TaxID=2060906 RepID=A0A0H1BF63_9EURO|nr:NAD-dependent histone deacetylase SIR2 [Blastomyces silverae]